MKTEGYVSNHGAMTEWRTAKGNHAGSLEQQEVEPWGFAVSWSTKRKKSLKPIYQKFLAKSLATKNGSSVVLL